ncbi:uncharacterized protein EV422DRAFT_86326 [Fimicolochytrium jonesii]|uniref:uncharacterized protein n=1 Tax=Fimicolochytrium jonesii TaxID=1396493 RepID=UPI0022FDB55C|nr:uncharacterized protein EV422DRAFT_86326 [Fimicolochytrium jonesii]KAI8820293.1 hypothetical protein EV422DRAFT_86326 [Fimicolochytrium jonesii]
MSKGGFPFQQYHNLHEAVDHNQHQHPQQAMHPHQRYEQPQEMLQDQNRSVRPQHQQQQQQQQQSAEQQDQQRQEVCQDLRQRIDMNDRPDLKPSEKQLRTACEACRYRKIKCSGEPEGCEHCRSKQQECIYYRRLKAGRPFNASKAISSSASPSSSTPSSPAAEGSPSSSMADITAIRNGVPVRLPRPMPAASASRHGANRRGSSAMSISDHGSPRDSPSPFGTAPPPSRPVNASESAFDEEFRMYTFPMSDSIAGHDESGSGFTDPAYGKDDQAHHSTSLRKLTPECKRRSLSSYVSTNCPNQKASRIAEEAPQSLSAPHSEEQLHHVCLFSLVHQQLLHVRNTKNGSSHEKPRCSLAAATAHTGSSVVRSAFTSYASVPPTNKGKAPTAQAPPKTLSPVEGLQLTETFFITHPLSYLVNKTLFIQSDGFISRDSPLFRAVTTAAYVARKSIGMCDCEAGSEDQDIFAMDGGDDAETAAACSFDDAYAARPKHDPAEDALETLQAYLIMILHRLATLTPKDVLEWRETGKRLQCTWKLAQRWRLRTASRKASLPSSSDSSHPSPPPPSSSTHGTRQSITQDDVEREITNFCWWTCVLLSLHYRIVSGEKVDSFLRAMKPAPVNAALVILQDGTAGCSAVGSIPSHEDKSCVNKVAVSLQRSRLATFAAAIQIAEFAAQVHTLNLLDAEIAKKEGESHTLSDASLHSQQHPVMPRAPPTEPQKQRVTALRASLINELARLSDSFAFDEARNSAAEGGGDSSRAIRLVSTLLLIDLLIEPGSPSSSPTAAKSITQPLDETHQLASYPTPTRSPDPFRPLQVSSARRCPPLQAQDQETFTGASPMLLPIIEGVLEDVRWVVVNVDNTVESDSCQNSYSKLCVIAVHACIDGLNSMSRLHGVREDTTRVQLEQTWSQLDALLVVKPFLAAGVELVRPAAAAPEVTVAPPLQDMGVASMTEVEHASASLSPHPTQSQKRSRDPSHERNRSRSRSRSFSSPALALRGADTSEAIAIAAPTSPAMILPPAPPPAPQRHHSSPSMGTPNFPMSGSPEAVFQTSNHQSSADWAAMLFPTMSAPAPTPIPPPIPISAAAQHDPTSMLSALPAMAFPQLYASNPPLMHMATPLAALLQAHAAAAAVANATPAHNNQALALSTAAAYAQHPHHTHTSNLLTNPIWPHYPQLPLSLNMNPTDVAASMLLQGVDLSMFVHPHTQQLLDPLHYIRRHSAPAVPVPVPVPLPSPLTAQHPPHHHEASMVLQDEFMIPPHMQRHEQDGLADISMGMPAAHDQQQHQLEGPYQQQQQAAGLLQQQQQQQNYTEPSSTATANPSAAVEDVDMVALMDTDLDEMLWRM